MKRSIWTLGLVAAFALGCTSTVPPARVASTEAAVQSAREAGADRVPNASTHLKMAEDELGKAKILISEERDTDEAEALLVRAKSDAALAAALSHEAKTKAETGALIEPGSAKQPVAPGR